MLRAMKRQKTNRSSTRNSSSSEVIKSRLISRSPSLKHFTMTQLIT